MKDLEQLKTQVLEEVEQDLQHELAVATKEQENRTSSANATLAQTEANKKTALKAQYKSQWEKDRQSLVNASKKEVLQVKRDLLASIFTEVEEILNSWSGQTLLQFIQSAVQQLPVGEETVLLFGEGTASKLGDSERATLQQQVTVSQETLPHTNGFVLRQAGIEYNYIYKDLMEDLTQEYSPELARKAFEA